MSEVNSGTIDIADFERTVVVGTTGSGKSTAAKRLATALGSAYVDLDAINWQANWTALIQNDVPLFRTRVEEAVSGGRWVVDGNYGAARDLVWPRATAIVWLDYSRWVIARRLLGRTFVRSFARKELWAGNRESLRRSFMSRDSILLWALKSYGPIRRRYPGLLAQPENAHLHVLHMRRPSDTERWLTDVEVAANGRMV